ncbi:MAG: error-prone DNA polymerase, partial [Chloroflexi bacterium]|nr:error-prone DNA polymerase [Chloroflexota bacterium]
YVELHCHSNYSFLDGASHPEYLAQRAAELQMPALALTDHNGLYAAIIFYEACKQAGIKPIIGAEITLENGHHITLLAKNNAGYSNLSRLITRAHLSHDKGNPSIPIESLPQYIDGLFCLSGCRDSEIASLILQSRKSQACEAAAKCIDIFGKDNFWMEIQNNFYPEDTRLTHTLVTMAQNLGIGYVATNNVHYACEEGYRLHDVLTAIKNRSTLDDCRSLRLNSEFYLKSGTEMSCLFRDYPEAISNTLILAEQCNVDLDFSAYRFPEFPLPPGETVHNYLTKICYTMVRSRYEVITPEVESQLKYELNLIRKLDLSGYFLIVWDIMEYARRNNIPAQGRGSAANSIVAYILGITRVDPISNKLFVGRFINEEMASLPDIDIDISTNHREQVIQYVYEKYGADHTAMVCTYVTFQARNAIREVGKVLGMPAHILDRMARSVSHYRAGEVQEDLAGIDEFRPYFDSTPWETFTSICRQIADFPRHLSIHVGGMLISSCPLTDIVPLENATMPGRVVCQWDKDGVADAGLIKVDLLGLRILSLVQEVCEQVEESEGRKIDLAQIPHDDPKVYDMICSSDTVGVFQIESRVQMQTLPQTKPRSIEDLTVEVAIIRPGPLQGNMVNPYIRRRQGKEKVSYLHPLLESVLEETLGVILFQEQVIQVATIIAGFTAGEADSLRRAMSRKRSKEAMERMRQRFAEGARANGVDEKKASSIFEILKGFAAYGFCKSHAAGFALLGYESAWLKTYYPAQFYAALLNNQPMGFYTPEVLASDAKRHGVALLPVDINRSHDKCTVEAGKVRLSFRYVKGLGGKAIDAILAVRNSFPFVSLDDFYYRARIDADALQNLIMIGAFDSFGSSRRQALWQLGLLEKTSPEQLPLELTGTRVSLPEMVQLEEMKYDYDIQGLSATYHPMRALGREVLGNGTLRSSELEGIREGERVKCAGYVVTRQRPMTAKGFSFLTLEDEEGMINVILKPNIYEKYRQIFRLELIMEVEGTIQKKNGIINIIADRLSPLINQLGSARIPMRGFCRY